MEKRINVAALINSPNATSQEDGILLFETAWAIIEAGFDVQIDFEGVNVLIARFLHFSVGRLRKTLGNAYTERVSVVNFSQPTWRELYESVIVSKRGSPRP